MTDAPVRHGPTVVLLKSFALAPLFLDTLI